MVRSLGVVLVASAFFLGSAGDCAAVMRAPLLGNGSAGVMSRGTGSGGLLARLNRPLVRPMPGMPTVSPLGLIAPRLSNAVSMFQLGGFRTPTGRLSALGVLSPRLSPGCSASSACRRGPRRRSSPTGWRSSRRGWPCCTRCCGCPAGWWAACGSRPAAGGLAAVGRFKVPVGTGYRNACRRFVAGSARRR